MGLRFLDLSPTVLFTSKFVSQLSPTTLSHMQEAWKSPIRLDVRLRLRETRSHCGTGYDGWGL